MKARTKDEWDEYRKSIKCPCGWTFSTEYGKYRIFRSVTNETVFYIWKKRRFLFWTWYSPMFIFQT